MSGKRNVSVCRGHELANALYIVGGDFNRASTHSLTLFGLQNIVTFYTRLHSKLDHLFVKCKDIFKARKRAPLSTSDHYIIYALPCVYPHTNPCEFIRSSFRTVHSRNVSSSYMSNISTLLEQTGFSLFYGPFVDESIDTVTSCVRFCYDICCPVEKLFIYPHKISSPLLKCLRRKDEH